MRVRLDGGGTGGVSCASDDECDLAAGEYCNGDDGVRVRLDSRRRHRRRLLRIDDECNLVASEYCNGDDGVRVRLDGLVAGRRLCASDDECDLAAGEYCNLEMMECVSDSTAGGGTGGVPAHQTMNATLWRASTATWR